MTFLNIMVLKKVRLSFENLASKHGLKPECSLTFFFLM